MRSQPVLLACLLALFLSQNVEIQAAKILAIFPSGSNSHVILGQALLKGLAKKGHQVTMVSPYPLAKPVANHRDIKMRDLKHDLLVLRNASDDSRKVVPPSNNMISFHKNIYSFGHDLTQLSIEDKVVQNLLRLNETYDLIISEIFMNDLFIAFGDHYKVPVVGFTTIGANVWSNDHVGNPDPYSISPETLLDFTAKMTFFQRMYNVYVKVINELMYNFYHLPNEERLRQKYLPHTKSLYECLKDVSLVFVNSHPSYTNARAMVPNMIEIGGFHVDPPNALPTDLQNILDESKDGVIFFSMGGNFESRNFNTEVKKAFIEVFGKLKQTVLWKWEDDILPDQPKNVIIRKWFPQSDILAHPNVKLFMTHGGLLSTIEGVVRGVPLLGIPVMADQHYNLRNAEKFGFASYLEFSNLTKESISWALNEILTNPSYTENVKTRSSILHDRIVHPIDEAAYWIEYVIRHKGAKHLRTARSDLNRFQYLLLDVIGFILGVIILILGTIYYTLKKVISKFSKSKTIKKSNRKKVD